MNRRQVAEMIASTYGDGSIVECESSDMIAAIEAALLARDERAARIAQAAFPHEGFSSPIAAAILNEDK